MLNSIITFNQNNSSTYYIKHCCHNFCLINELLQVRDILWNVDVHFISIMIYIYIYIYIFRITKLLRCMYYFYFPGTVGPHYNTVVEVHNMLTVLYVYREARWVLSGWVIIGSPCIHFILHHPLRLHTTVYLKNVPRIV